MNPGKLWIGRAHNALIEIFCKQWPRFCGTLHKLYRYNAEYIMSHVLDVFISLFG